MNKLFQVITLLAGLALSAVACAAPEMVRIPDKNYEIGKYEVTQKEWQAVMGSNPSKFTACGENCPVEQVSWNDVQVFLQKLNAQTGKQYRLPTEDEWFYACLGGSQTLYCGGNDLGSVGWYDDNSGDTPHPVGQKQANGYGLYDMSGNVWEWLGDCYNGDCGRKALRGGAWGSSPQYARAADRLGNDSARQGGLNGFRLARTLTPDDDKPAAKPAQPAANNGAAAKEAAQSGKPASDAASANKSGGNASSGGGLKLQLQERKPEAAAPAPKPAPKPAEPPKKQPEAAKEPKMVTTTSRKESTMSADTQETACRRAESKVEKPGKIFGSPGEIKIISQEACSCTKLSGEGGLNYRCTVNYTLQTTLPEGSNYWGGASGAAGR